MVHIDGILIMSDFNGNSGDVSMNYIHLREEENQKQAAGRTQENARQAAWAKLLHSFQFDKQGRQLMSQEAAAEKVRQFYECERER